MIRIEDEVVPIPVHPKHAQEVFLGPGQDRPGPRTQHPQDRTLRRNAATRQSNHVHVRLLLAYGRPHDPEGRHHLRVDLELSRSLPLGVPGRVPVPHIDNPDTTVIGKCGLNMIAKTQLRRPTLGHLQPLQDRQYRQDLVYVLGLIRKQHPFPRHESRPLPDAEAPHPLVRGVTANPLAGPEI